VLSACLLATIEPLFCGETFAVHYALLELTLVSARLEGAMDTKLYLTIGAVAAILYALAFLLFPVNASPLL
jgi:uncharacterized protein involved in response to NO